MRRVDHLLDTVDCAHPGCPDEAAKGSEFCADHRPGARHHTPPISHTEQARQARLERMFGITTTTAAADDAPVFSSPADALQYLRGGTPPAASPPAPPAPEETPVRRCKIDGCQNEAGAARMGPYANVCDHHRDEMRATVQKNARKAGAARHARTPALKPPAAAPAPNPTPPADASPAARLAQLTVEIDQTRERLVDLQAEALQLLDAIREQVAA